MNGHLKGLIVALVAAAIIAIVTSNIALLVDLSGLKRDVVNVNDRISRISERLVHVNKHLHGGPLVENVP